MWASLATSLNDPSEVSHGLQCARNRIERYDGPIDKNFVLRIGHLLEPGNVRQAFRMEFSPYIISFCARVDSALHWLHYGRSGTGVAIGFDSKSVQRKPFDLFKVVYDEREQRTLVDTVMESTATCLQQNLPKVTGSEVTDLIDVAAHIASARLWAVAPLMKNQSFAPEEEWRLITYDVKGERVRSKYLTPLPMGYRTVSGRVVPYQELVFDQLPAIEIVLGWSAAMSPDDPGLAQLLRGTSGDVKIRRSPVPVRP
jgi:hypothetical protein